MLSIAAKDSTRRRIVCVRRVIGFGDFDSKRMDDQLNAAENTQQNFCQIVCMNLIDYTDSQLLLVFRPLFNQSLEDKSSRSGIDMQKGLSWSFKSLCPREFLIDAHGPGRCVKSNASGHGRSLSAALIAQKKPVVSDQVTVVAAVETEATSSSFHHSFLES